MSGGGSAPAPPDYYAQTANELQAKVDLAPKVFATEAQYDPQYAALQVQTLRDTLTGTKAGKRQVQTTQNTPGFRNTQTGEFRAGSTAPAFYPTVNDRFGNLEQNPWMPFTQTNNVTNTIDTPAQPGYLDLAGTVSDKADQLQALSQTRQRSSDIADVGNLGPDSLAAMMKADPQQAALLTGLTDQAQTGLDRGTMLDPSQMRLVQQSVRAGQAARGMGFGPSDNYDEALGLSQFGQDIRNQRLSQAASVVGLRQGTYGDAFGRVLGRPVQPNGSSALQAGYGIDQNSGPRLFGSTVNAGNVFDTAFNAQQANYISGQNNAAATNSAAIGGGITLAATGILVA